MWNGGRGPIQRKARSANKTRQDKPVITRLGVGGSAPNLDHSRRLLANLWKHLLGLETRPHLDLKNPQHRDRREAIQGLDPLLHELLLSAEVLRMAVREHAEPEVVCARSSTSERSIDEWFRVGPLVFVMFVRGRRI